MRRQCVPGSHFRPRKRAWSGTAPLLKLFRSPEILGNMNMQILRPLHGAAHVAID